MTCKGDFHKCDIPFRFLFQWCSPIWWYLLNCRLSSWPMKRRWCRNSWLLQRSCLACNGHHNIRRWNLNLNHPLWNLFKEWRLPDWLKKLEGLCMDPILQQCNLFQVVFRSWLFGTFWRQWEHEVIFLVRLNVSQWGVWLCGLFVGTARQHRFSKRRCVHEHNRSYLQFYQQCILLLRMFLKYSIENTWISTANDTSLISDGHDGCTHSFMRIEEAFWLALLSC